MQQREQRCRCRLRVTLRSLLSNPIVRPRDPRPPQWTTYDLTRLTVATAGVGGGPEIRYGSKNRSSTYDLSKLRLCQGHRIFPVTYKATLERYSHELAR